MQLTFISRHRCICFRRSNSLWSLSSIWSTASLTLYVQITHILVQCPQPLSVFSWANLFVSLPQRPKYYIFHSSSSFLNECRTIPPGQFPPDNSPPPKDISPRRTSPRDFGMAGLSHCALRSKSRAYYTGPLKVVTAPLHSSAFPSNPVLFLFFLCIRKSSIT